MSSSARRVNTPSPTPNAGDSAPVSSPRNAECAATPTLGKEEEEEEEEKEEEEETEETEETEEEKEEEKGLSKCF